LDQSREYLDPDSNTRLTEIEKLQMEYTTTWGNWHVLATHGRVWHALRVQWRKSVLGMHQASFCLHVKCRVLTGLTNGTKAM